MQPGEREQRPGTLLLTGRPGSGKTTLVRRLAERLADCRLGGFTTEEVRENGRRVGFRIETFDGRRAILARVDLPSRHRVGRYGIDVAAIDAVVEPSLDRPAELYLVDEIGKMECLSARFVDAMRRRLDGKAPLVATVAKRGGGFIEEVKRRSDVELWCLTPANRDELLEKAEHWLREAAESF